MSERPSEQGGAATNAHRNQSSVHRADADYRSDVRQRRLIRDICDLLRSDLFKREGSGEASAIWRSPLGWAVEYGHNDDRQTIWATIYKPDGTQYASNDLATVYWLEETLP